ncbi:MAG: alpha/beta hydrolase family protein [Anaerolineae bacterium]
MKRFSRIYILLLVLVALLIACQNGARLAEPDSIEVADLPTPPTMTPLPTAALTIVLPPTATATPIPTNTLPPTSTAEPTNTPLPTETPTPTHPLMIEVMRQQAYPGSELTIVETLESGSNFFRYIVSYESEGNTIFAVLNVPWGDPPPTGWPVIVFNHGFIRPDQYVITQYYDVYMGVFASNGYIVINSDYRGHGESEGEAIIAYRSPGYTADVLNALAAVKTYESADPNRIGMYGHSMGGFIALRSMVISDEIKAGVLWGGVVVNYDDLLELWRPRQANGANATAEFFVNLRQEWREEWNEQYGSVEENPEFWRSVSSNSYLTDISGPIQLHHAIDDAIVPALFSEILQAEAEEAGVASELFLYEVDNHNISNNFWTAMQRSVDFFDLHVKAAGN